jgi:hypothetical protein
MCTLAFDDEGSEQWRDDLDDYGHRGHQNRPATPTGWISMVSGCGGGHARGGPRPSSGGRAGAVLAQCSDAAPVARDSGVMEGQTHHLRGPSTGALRSPVTVGHNSRLWGLYLGRAVAGKAKKLPLTPSAGDGRVRMLPDRPRPSPATGGARLRLTAALTRVNGGQPGTAPGRPAGALALATAQTN